MKLEVGMYAYSKSCRDFGIGKIVNIRENEQDLKGDLIDVQYKYTKLAIIDSDLVASFNIVDLIEEGDYVNGHRVEYIDDCKGAMRKFYWFDEYETHQCGHCFEKIKLIVTKEQFEQMSYKVGEKDNNKK